MNTYRIAQKENTLRAINIDEKDGISTILSLEEDGYVIATSLIEANDPTEAIQLYLSSDYLSSEMEPNSSPQTPHNESEKDPEKNSMLWDIFRILFVIAMIIVAEM